MVRATVSIILKTSSIDSLRPMMLQPVRQPERAPAGRFPLQLAVLDLPDFHPQIDVERLAQVVGGAEAHRFDRALGGGKRGNHDAEDVLVDPLGRAQHLDAADVRHLDVGDQDVHGLFLEQRDGARAVLGEQDFVAFAPEHDGQQLAHRALVVHDEDARRAPLGGHFRHWRVHAGTTARAGRRTATVVPLPG